LAELAGGNVEWQSALKAVARVYRRERSQRITLHAYRSGVRLVSVISPLTSLEPRSEWGGRATVENVQNWAYETTSSLALGYLDVRPAEELVFGIHVLHGNLNDHARMDLVKQVAWRADAWEAELTGADNF
jgi:hypothetical protein